MDWWDQWATLESHDLMLKISCSIFSCYSCEMTSKKKELTWASAKQMKLIAADKAEEASEGLSADIGDCKDGITS